MSKSTFARTSKKRKAFIHGLARSLVLHGRISTTEARAKEIKTIVDKLITRGKVQSVANTRLLTADLGEDAAQKLIKEIAPSFAERRGGYTRVLHLPPRKSDAARMAILELVK